MFALQSHSDVRITWQIQKSIRLFSTSPYLTLGTRVKKILPAGCKIGDVLLFDPTKEEIVTVPDKTIPEELMDEEMMGASHGWGFFCDRTDRSVRISDIFNPLASKTNPVMIPLPRLTALPTGQTEKVFNVAMSSSSPLGEEDCVVAIKFSGIQLSLCRPGCDLEWTNIVTPFNCLDTTQVSCIPKETKNFTYLPLEATTCSPMTSTSNQMTPLGSMSCSIETIQCWISPSGSF